MQFVIALLFGKSFRTNFLDVAIDDFLLHFSRCTSVDIIKMELEKCITY